MNLTNASGSTTLPRLRDDLQIIAASPDPTGAPAWMIHDPLQGRYFHISKETRDLLLQWRTGITAQELASTLRNDSRIEAEETDIQTVADFLRANGLVALEHPQSWREIAEQAKRVDRSLIAKLVHNYLFFKVPLFRPQRMLERALPFVEPLYSKTVLFAVALTGITGLYLVSRQWDAFVSTFQDHMSWPGLVTLAVTLCFTKALHELGHAFTAVRLGCRVPTMGVAFMVLAPLLYTDVSDAWRLTARKDRLSIHGAGILVELALASLATLLWSFLPDGPLRSAAFTVAAVSWLVTLAVNLNPLMRFDGYYLFADWLGIDNLQSRSNALGQWKLRRILFAPELAPPENLPSKLRTGLVAFAWLSWIYRFFVFAGIALVVYHYFFKALGLILFMVEIWYFIARPVLREMKSWTHMDRAYFSKGRTVLTGGTAILALLLLILPISGRIQVPALAESAPLIRVYPTSASRISTLDVKQGDIVLKGQIIAKLERPEIASEIEAAKIKLGLTRMRLARAADEKKDRDGRLILLEEEAALRTRLAGLEKERAELTVRAPISGRIVEFPRELHPGRWIGKNDLIAMIASETRVILHGYIAGNDLHRVNQDAQGQFIPDDLTRSSFPVRLTRVSHSGSRTVEVPELATTNGGMINAVLDPNNVLTPLGAEFRVELEPQETGPIERTVRGTISLQATSESVLGSVIRHISRVLIRESGF